MACTQPVGPPPPLPVLITRGLYYIGGAKVQHMLLIFEHRPNIGPT